MEEVLTLRFVLWVLTLFAFQFKQEPSLFNWKPFLGFLASYCCPFFLFVGEVFQEDLAIALGYSFLFILLFFPFFFCISVFLLFTFVLVSFFSLSFFLLLSMLFLFLNDLLQLSELFS